jgi:hypothetical protein
MLDTDQPADRLAAIRSCISDLKEEEARLRIGFLEEGDYGVFKGETCNVIVEREEAREFDPSRLPMEVRLDPRYWTTRFRTYVHVQEKSQHPAWQDEAVIDLVRQGGVYR